MRMKTLTGSSIQSALAEARRRLGEDVVLVESTAAADEAPARITVMVDASANGPEPTDSPRQAPRPVPKRAGFGYAAAPSGTFDVEESAAAFAEDFSPTAVALAPTPPKETAAVATVPAQQRTSARGRLFPSGDAGPPLPATSDATQRLEAQLKRLHERMDELERRFGPAVIGASYRWAAHPLFHELLDQGMQPDTAARLFGQLAERGHGPDTNPEELRWALAQGLRRALAASAPQHATGPLLLLGPGGAGKTSLLLKLAAHTNFFARRRPAVLVIPPAESGSTAHQSPTDLYRRFGLPVRTVRSASEMKHALERTAQFDQLLIDTPSLPMRTAPARTMLRRIEQIAEPLLPLRTHLVLSATRSFDSFDPERLDRLPLTPDAVALTHLDEAPGWGRVAEWLLAAGRPVQFVSTGPSIPDDLVAFSPTWFVEEMIC